MSKSVLFPDIFVTTAEKGDGSDRNYKWKVVCLNKKTGKIIWEQTAYRGIPGMERHLRTSYSNSTPVTDGKHVVAFFGAKGLFCFDNKGNVAWPVVPTPIIAGDMIFITSAMKGKQPFFAFKLHPSGKISLQPGERSNDSVIWSLVREGSYISTPLIYKDYIYNIMSYGLFICFEAKTGNVMYRHRFRSAGDFIASPVVSDGKLYLTGRRGVIVVVKAGP